MSSRSPGARGDCTGARHRRRCGAHRSDRPDERHADTSGRSVRDGTPRGHRGRARRLRVWRIVVAIADVEGKGRAAKGVALRFASFCRGLFHLALAVSAAKLVMGCTARSRTDDEKQMAATALSLPGGRFVLVGVAIGQAALLRDASKAKGVAESTRTLFALGPLPYIALALGLAAYGVYQLVEARFRRITVA